MLVSDAIAKLGTETAFDVLARAAKLSAEGKDIINLGIGQPDFKTAPHIVAVQDLSQPTAVVKLPVERGGDCRLAGPTEAVEPDDLSLLTESRFFFRPGNKPVMGFVKIVGHGGRSKSLKV